MKVIMVKKRLASGEECRRCQEAEAFLRDKGLFLKVDVIVWFDESVSGDEGHRLAEQYGAERAPFWIIEHPGREPEMIPTVMKLYRLL